MTEPTKEEMAMALEAEIAELKKDLEDLREAAGKKRVLDFDSVKSAIDEGARGVIKAIKPMLEKYEEPSKAAVAKVGGKVSDNPFLSVIVAFGAGIVIGKILDSCCRGDE